jgi:exodeoxyribonuclease VII small subunit
MPKNAPADDDANADVAELGYEDARDELAAIVARLESGTETLEESMRLWERGEALAAHCERWLDGAQRKIDAMTAEAGDD